MRRAVIAAVAAGLLLLTTSTIVSAQSLGVRGGINLSTIKSTPSEALGLDASAEVGVTAGGFLGFHDAARLSFEVGGQLSVRRVAFGSDITDTITYAEVPAVARYAFVRGEGMTFRALGGACMGFRLTASETVAGQSSSATDSYKPFDVAVVIGAQAEWHQRWLVEGRYLYGLSEPYEVTIGGLESKQQGFQILVGYRFR